MLLHFELAVTSYSQSSVLCSWLETVLKVAAELVAIVDRDEHLQLLQAGLLSVEELICLIWLLLVLEHGQLDAAQDLRDVSHLVLRLLELLQLLHDYLELAVRKDFLEIHDELF